MSNPNLKFPNKLEDYMKQFHQSKTTEVLQNASDYRYAIIFIVFISLYCELHNWSGERGSKSQMILKFDLYPT